MSILANAKTDTPSKVHYTEYILTENGPRGPQADIPKHLEQFVAQRTQLAPHRYAVFKKTVVRILHV